jgi:hypothetical protein
MMNDSANTYYSNCRWADATRNASGFYANNNQPFKYTSHAYPVGENIVARANLWLLGCPAGDYNVTWQGNADVKILGMGGVKWKSIDANHGTLTLPAACKWVQTQWGWNPTELSFIEVTRSDPANPLDALHVWLPGYGPGSPHAGKMYHDQHLAIVRKFAGVRCMNSLNVASGTEAHWAERVPLEGWDWSTKAVPIEADVELAKEAGVKRLWVNIPIKADDDYVRNAAKLYHDKLPHGVELIVELGNENWNWGGGFIGWPTVHEIANQVRPEAFDGAISGGKLMPLDHDADGKPVYVTDEYVRSARCAADRAREVALIFQNVYRDRPRGLLNVYCGCAADPRWITLGLEFLTAKYGAQPFQLIGIAPYIHYYANNGQYFKPSGPNGAATLDDIFKACDAYMSDTNSPGIPWQVAQHHALAQQYRVRLVDYEGGQHFFPQDKPYTGKDLSTQAQTDPRMGALYDKYFATLHKYGVAMHCDFLPIGQPWDEHGYWADLQDYADVANNPPRWASLMREAARSN